MTTSVMTSIGMRLQRLVTTVARKQLKSSSSSVLGSCRHQSSNVVVEEDDEQIVVVDSKRLDATSRRVRLQADDHTDRHVRSSGGTGAWPKDLCFPCSCYTPCAGILIPCTWCVGLCKQTVVLHSVHCPIPLVGISGL